MLDSQNGLDKQPFEVLNKRDLPRNKAMEENKLALKTTTFHHVQYVPWAMADPSCFIYWARASVPQLGTGTPLVQAILRGPPQTFCNYCLHSNNSIILIRMRHSVIQQL